MLESEIARRSPGIGHRPLFAMSVLLFAASAVWIVFAGRHQWAGEMPDAMAHRLLLDATYTPDEMRGALALSQAIPTSRAAVSASVLALGLFEQDGAHRTQDVISRAHDEAEKTIISALRLSPQQGFLWFALYSLRKQRSGPDVPSDVAFLAMSYRYAPLEGWIAIRRSPLVLPLAPALPNDIQQAVRLEFQTLLQQNIEPAVRSVFWTGDQSLRLQVLAHIAKLPIVLREHMLSVITKSRP